MARYIKCIIVFVLILLISSNAYAIGDGNIDSGGGGMSQGTSQNNKWSVGGFIYGKYKHKYSSK